MYAAVSRSRLYAGVALVVVTVGASGVRSGAPAAAATSAYLTPAAWEALAGMPVFPRSHMSASATCSSSAHDSSDPEIRGIVGICTDGIQYALYWEVEIGACGPLVSSKLDEGNASLTAACESGLKGGGGDLSGAGAWFDWLAAKVARGACQAALQHASRSFMAVAAADARFAADLRAHASPGRLSNDNSQSAGAGTGAKSSRGLVTQPCKPQ